MKKIIKWVKTNWTDPVWSKVFAGIILSIAGGIITIIVALYKQIPINDLWDKVVNKYVQINYLLIIITFIILLALLISSTLLSANRFRKTHQKLPDNLKSNGFNLTQFLSGQWFLTFTHPQSGQNGSEPVKFINGSQYYIGSQLIFILTNITFNEKEKILTWTKWRNANQRVHATETLRIIDNNTLQGTDDLGYTVNYVRTSK